MSLPELKYEVPSWQRIYSMLLDQSQKICKSSFKPDVIAGVSRGGWIPARFLSDLLENVNLANIKTESYIGIGEAKGDPEITQRLSVDVIGKRVLVVDEVADSGRSLKIVTRHVMDQGAREVKTATLYLKPFCAFHPDYYETETNCWVVFPWEIKETVREILNAHKTDLVRTEKEIAELVEAGVSKKLISQFLKEFSELKTC